MKLRITPIVCLLFAFLTPVAAQPRQATAADAVSLRTAFLKASEPHFELVRDEMKSRTSGGWDFYFWLAYVKPRAPGYYELQYSFKPQNKHYSHVEHQVLISVGPKGCRRGPPSYGAHSRFCLGDTIIIPVTLDSPADYEFKLKATSLRSDEDWTTFEEQYPAIEEKGFDKTPVANPSEHLRYLGRRAPKMLHASLGYTLELDAVFEAVKPGKFNLAVSPSEQTTGSLPFAVPIIIVDRGQPATLLAGRETIRGFTAGPDGREWVSSTSGNGYMTELLVLQPGDRITLTYFRARRGAQFERDGYARPGAADPAEAIKPVITVHPFSFEQENDFGQWIMEYWR